MPYIKLGPCTKCGDYIKPCKCHKENIGYNWKDPDIDPAAAIRQIQEILDAQLKAKKGTEGIWEKY